MLLDQGRTVSSGCMPGMQLPGGPPRQMLKSVKQLIPLTGEG